MPGALPIHLYWKTKGMRNSVSHYKASIIGLYYQATLFHFVGTKGETSFCNPWKVGSNTFS